MVPPEPPGPTPIPVEGDVQIFADPECTTYADGTQETVYARINIPWGINGEWQVPVGIPNTKIYCSAPTTANPDDPYSLNWYIDWVSSDYSEPFTVGEIVPLHNGATYEISDVQTVFNKP